MNKGRRLSPQPMHMLRLDESINDIKASVLLKGRERHIRRLVISYVADEIWESIAFKTLLWEG